MTFPEGSDVSSFDYIHLEGPPDAGESTLERYRYQFTYAAILTVLLFKDSSDYKELFCEHYEDIVAVSHQNKLTGIQVKTRDLSYGPFKISHDEMIDTIVRFIDLDNNNPNMFEKFIIVSNCSFVKDKYGFSYWKSRIDLNNTISEDGSLMIARFITRCKEKKKKLIPTETEFISILGRLECIEGPGIDGIHEKALEHLRNLDFRGNDSYHRLEEVLRHIISIIFFRSSRKIDGCIPSYCRFLEGSVDIPNIDFIKGKRINKETILSVIHNQEDLVFLRSRDRSKTEFKGVGSIYLMIEKMKAGHIDASDIQQFEKLFVYAESYILEQSNRLNGERHQERINQIEQILLNISVEARSRAKVNIESAPYGTTMLHIIEDEIKNTLKTHPRDVFEFPYEILKGIVAILTSDCQIRYSDKEVVMT